MEGSSTTSQEIASATTTNWTSLLLWLPSQAGRRKKKGMEKRHLMSADMAWEVIPALIAAVIAAGVLAFGTWGKVQYRSAKEAEAKAEERRRAEDARKVMEQQVLAIRELREKFDRVVDASRTLTPGASEDEAVAKLLERVRDEVQKELAEAPSDVARPVTQALRGSTQEALVAWKERYPSVPVVINVENMDTRNVPNVVRSVEEFLQRAGITYTFGSIAGVTMGATFPPSEKSPYVIAAPEHLKAAASQFVQALGEFIQTTPELRTAVDQGTPAVEITFAGAPWFSSDGRVSLR